MTDTHSEVESVSDVSYRSSQPSGRPGPSQNANIFADLLVTKPAPTADTKGAHFENEAKLVASSAATKSDSMVSLSTANTVSTARTDATPPRSATEMKQRAFGSAANSSLPVATGVKVLPPLRGGKLPALSSLKPLTSLPPALSRAASAKVFLNIHHTYIGGVA